MILPDWQIRQRGIFTPFCERSKQRGMSYGLSFAGYDVRVDLDDDHNLMGDVYALLLPPGRFVLASTMEHFAIPNDVMGIVHDKSTWARLGLAVQNTVLEPGWRGYLTLELTNHGPQDILVYHGDPIAQIVLHQLAAPPEHTYEGGKYQDQEQGPQAARFEE